MNVGEQPPAPRFTLADQVMPPKIVESCSHFTVQPVTGQRPRVQHRCGSPGSGRHRPGRPRLQSGTGCGDPKEDRMATEPTGSTAEGQTRSEPGVSMEDAAFEAGQTDRGGP
jgi:hypothetical protein